jgi:hypothetical protein
MTKPAINQDVIHALSEWLQEDELDRECRVTVFRKEYRVHLREYNPTMDGRRTLAAGYDEDVEAALVQALASVRR